MNDYDSMNNLLQFVFVMSILIVIMLGLYWLILNDEHREEYRHFCIEEIQGEFILPQFFDCGGYRCIDYENEIKYSMWWDRDFDTIDYHIVNRIGD